MFSSGRSSIDLSQVLAKTTELDILSKYLNIKDLPCVINSPLREDLKPSFGLYLNNNSEVRFKDFSTGEFGSIYDILERLWGMNFEDVLQRIYEESYGPSFTYNKFEKSKVPTVSCVRIQFKIRNWRDYDIAYWEKYGISLDWVKFGDIFPISRIFINKDDFRYDFPAEKYAYAYIERKDGILTTKVYQPYSKLHKWSNNNNSSVWELWNKLPKKGENLIITSSRKDALCIWDNTGIPSCSLQAESYLPKQHVVEELKSRFNNVFVLYDNDFKSEENHGQIFGRKFSEKFNIKQIEIPIIYKSKDTSDLALNYGRSVVNKVINSLIK